MKSESQDSVRSLFELPNDEKIFDDFGCSLIDGISYHGRLFLTENHICFNSNILGFKSKCVIPIYEVKSVHKNSSSKIDISTSNNLKQNKYSFSSFNNRDIAYKRIKMICLAYINKVNKKNDNSNLNASVSGGSKFSIELEDSRSEDSDEEANLYQKRSASLRSIKSGSSHSSGGDDNKKEEEQNTGPGDDIIFTNIDTNRDYEACRVVINLSTEEFFHKFLSEEVEDCGTAGFYLSLGDHLDIKISKWEENQNQNQNQSEEREESKNNEENQNQSQDKNEKKERIQTFLLKLKGVPFVNQSSVRKNQSYTKENHLYKISGTSSSVGVPYSDYFLIKDVIELYPYSNNTKTVLRTYVYNEFLKSTFLQNTITSTTKKQYQTEIDNWLNFIRSKGNTVEVYKESKKKAPTEELKLTHGIEKERTQTGYDVVENLQELLKFGDVKKYFYFAFIGLLFILLLSVLVGQGKQMKLLAEALEEIKNLKAEVINLKIDKQKQAEIYVKN